MPPIQMPDDQLKSLDKLAKRFYNEAIREIKSTQGAFTAEEMEMLVIHMMLTLAQDMQMNNVSVTDMANRIHKVAYTMEATFNTREVP